MGVFLNKYRQKPLCTQPGWYTQWAKNAILETDQAIITSSANEFQSKINLRVRMVAKRHMRSSMFTASFILVSCVKLPWFLE